MKIALVDVDSKIPNLPLMKISAYHKLIGDTVEWHGAFNNYDRCYASKVFTFTPDYNYFPACEVVKGGTGYDLSTKLPIEIEKINPDYSIYPNCDYSLQFFSRGCIRNCPFCIVHQKEGCIHAVEPLELNLGGKYIEVLDNNFFANPRWKIAAEQLIKWNQPVKLNGVDVRIMDEEQGYYLNKFKHKKQIAIAWDNPKDDILTPIKKMIKYVKPYKIKCYVLIGYWSTHEENLYRVMKLDELGVTPYVMSYKETDPTKIKLINKEIEGYKQNQKYMDRFERWVNMRATFKSCTWQEYK